MLGTGLQFGRMGSEDPFYTAVKARKNQNQLQKQAPERSRNDAFVSPNSSTERKTSGGSDKGKLKEEAAGLICRPSEDPSAGAQSNLERFLESTTPSVPAQHLSKTTMRGWKTCDVEFQPYFLLGDLWESFKEWSAYGAGVPLILDGSDCVVQYYVPYLSGIQLYGPLAHSNPKSRSGCEDSDSDYYKDLSSDGSSDDEFGNGAKFSQSSNKISSKLGGLSIDDQRSGQEGFSSDDGEGGNSRGCLLFEYLERNPPYSREPLTDKIMDLAQRFPALKTIKSCDLLPVSWISIAWYPIYRIPTGPTLKDLDACFLTYHTLSTSIEGCGGVQSPVIDYSREMESDPKIRLPVTGMATYKFKSSMWTQTGINERRRANSLTQSANNWLRQLGVNHPDFEFFASHGIHSR